MKKIQILTWIFAALFLAAACSSGGDEPANPGGAKGGGGGEPQPGGQRHLAGIQTGRERYAAFRIPAVVVSKAGTVLAFAEGRVDGSADDGNIDLLVKRSEDNGNTWNTPIKVYDRRRKPAARTPLPSYSTTAASCCCSAGTSVRPAAPTVRQQRPSAPGDENLFGRRRQNMEHP